MPKVGNKEYSYTKKGMEMAKKMAKKMGKKMTSKPTSKPMMKREMKPKGTTITEMLKRRKK